MSSRTKKIGIKQQLREAQLKAHGVGMYFREYKLNEHFMLYVNAMNEKKDLPPKLTVDGESNDTNTSS